LRLNLIRILHLKHFLYLIAIMTGLFIAGCNETIPTGSDVLPGSDNPSNFFTDTTTIYSSTVMEDSMRTDKLFLSQLGYTSDPTFGTTKASLTMGFKTPTFGLNLETFEDTIGGYYLDSIVLALMVNNIYGDTNKRMTLAVNKLANPLDQDKIYYSNSSLPQGMVEVGRLQNFYPELMREHDEDTILTDLGAQIRIPLNPFFGQSLLNILGTDQIYSNALFKQYMPGLVVIPDEQAGSMIEVDMITNTITTNVRTAYSDTRIHMYFKNAIDSSLSLVFPASILDVGVGNFEHDYSSTNVESALNSSAAEGDPVNYVQGLAGVKTKLEFPFIDAYDDNVAVLKAELIITRLLDGDEDEYPAPERLFALKIGEDGENENISDFSDLPAGHYGGFGDEVTLASGEEVMQYRINISDYFQNLIRGNEPNDGMYITIYGDQNFTLTTINDSDLIPDRIVIGGGNNTDDDYKMKLNLTYTVLD